VLLIAASALLLIGTFPAIAGSRALSPGSQFQAGSATLPHVAENRAPGATVPPAQVNPAPQAVPTGAGRDAATEGDPGQYVLEKLKLPDVHRDLRGDNVEIAVIDSQIDTMHPDLAGDVSGSYDAAGVEEKPHAHGTGMAGAIIAHQRLMGVAPNAHVVAIHAFSAKAGSPESATFSILKALDYAVSHNVRIVNMSFAGPRDPTLERAIKAAYDKNVIMIAAAGNAGPKSPPLYPAADPNVIAVTATDMDDKLFSGANRGKYVAIAAPGVDILVPAPSGAYQLTTGTSVATAHITGIVALMLERNPKLTPGDVRRILTASAKKLGPNDQFGAGLVDPAKAIQLAAPTSAEQDVPKRAAVMSTAPANLAKRITPPRGGK
jgi:subtilisin family serine protease